MSENNKLLRADLDENRVIRAELNIEQWQIWQLSKSSRQKNYKHKPKVIGKYIELENGEKFLAKVTAGISDYGVLTTEDQKTFYGLIKIWEDSGQPDDKVPFSVRQLMMILKIERSQFAVNALIQSLYRLRVNAISINYAFYDAVKKSRTKRSKPITILDDLDLVEVQEKGKPTKDKSIFQFSEIILKNLRANHRKPVLLDTVLDMKTDFGLMLYSFIDRQLFRGNEIKYTSETLFEELGIYGETYQYASARKRSLERAIEDIQDRPLSHGGTINAKIEPTKNRKDVNAIFKKQKLLSTSNSVHPLIKELTTFGMKETIAKELLANYSEDCIRRQIAAMPYRNAQYPAPYLEKAIREDYSLPHELTKNSKQQLQLQLGERPKLADPDAELYIEAEKIFAGLSDERKKELREKGIKMGLIDEYQIHLNTLLCIVQDLN